ncbi:hypothetical protein M407DRAFT_24548 [Tulasnella calospora MUT 4182]|uniref:Uncharacterized protein n=1 Tax=Tulasnella calospora MUT 4182 TaxID=1051891 RepID=A0A0C3KXG4_9AGAM|nr:hypothetical protein M407DRAFT_24548 [Tulasnella calospora MUT 4182]
MVPWNDGVLADITNSPPPDWRGYRRRFACTYPRAWSRGAPTCRTFGGVVFPHGPPGSFDGGPVIPQQLTSSQQYTGSRQHTGSQQYGMPQQHADSQQYGMPQQYEVPRQYTGAHQQTGSQQHTRSQQYIISPQHSGSQSYAGWGRIKRPDSSEPLGPFVPSLNHMLASTPYIPPVNLVTGNTHRPHSSPRHSPNRHTTESELTSPVVPPIETYSSHMSAAPVQQLGNPPYLQVKSHRSGGGYEPALQPSMYAGYRTPEPSSPPLPLGMITPNLASRPSTAEPWAHAPQDFQPPGFPAGAAAVATPRTAVSVFDKDFKTPRTIFEFIAFDQSSIYDPNSPDR